MSETLTSAHPGVSANDVAAIETQLGRVPRGAVEVSARCACGCPTVVRTLPRLPDGTPFPTSFYATCPRLTGAISTLESQGVMREMSDRLESDTELAAAYARAHEDYLARRAELGHVEEIAGISAGGMPTRVKCLHVLIAYALAEGAGHFRLGDEAVALAAEHADLRGTAIPADWPTCADLGIDIEQFDFTHAEVRK